VELERDVPEGLHTLERAGDRGGPERRSGPPRFVVMWLRVVQGEGQIFGTTFAFTVPTTRGTLFCTRMTRY
jgi:hypothetical protein